MIEVRIIDKTVVEYLMIVRDLKNSGYVVGVDFDFEYHPPEFDEFSNDAVYNRSVVFTFYKDELATWFKLVYE